MGETVLPKDLQGALTGLIEWLAGSNVPHAIIGGVAVSLIAQPRVTQDIDVVIWLPDEAWPELLTSGASFGFNPRIDQPLDFARRARVLLLRHEPSGISADISCGSLPFEREAIDRAITLHVAGLTLKVSTPEDLIIMKAVAGRPRDRVDIESILDTNPQLDLERVRHWVREFANVLECPEMADDLEKQIQYQQAKGRGRS